MSDIHVPKSNPEAFERMFVEGHEALGMQLSANSGAVWGDGDARPNIIDRSVLQFNAELKVRSGTPQHFRPVPNEWRKAREQLHKRNPGAVRLFVVYQQEPSTYAVSIPQDDYGNVLFALGDRISDRTHVSSTFECANDSFNLYRYQDWKEFYQEIVAFREQEDEQ